MGATNTLYACVNTQTKIDDITSEDANPLLQNQQTLGVTNALVSSINTTGVEIVQQTPRARPTATSNRKATVEGRLKSCPTVVTTKPDVCVDETPETSDLIDQEVYVSNPNYVRFTIDRNVYRDSCDTSDGSNSMVLSYKMIEAVNSILKAENNEHISALIADVDNYFDGDASTVNGGTEKTISLYSATAPIAPQPGELFKIIEEYRRKGYTGITPILTGGTTLGRWAFDAQIYAGNVDGADITKVPGNLPTWIDYEIDTQAQSVGPNTDSRFLTWIPTQVQRLTYLDYVIGSPLRRSTDSITYTTMSFNVNGRNEVFDVEIHDADCNQLITVVVGRHSDLFIPSSNFFDAACGGQESILTWITNCADMTCPV